VARDAAELPSASTRISWFTPADAADRTPMARWRMSVGPPLVVGQPFSDPQAHDALTIVSWNTAVGAADIVGFVRSLPNPGGPLILLLQEVYRDGPEVPAHPALGFAFARPLGGPPLNSSDRDIEDIARALDLTAYYVPSMRNGGSTSTQDRGNAILSSIRLEALSAIELPFERQRRVAIAARVAGHTHTGTPWRLRVASVHLDNLGGARRVWVGSEYGRARQARSLAEMFDGDNPTILAGDFNTWFGFSDQAYIETARAFPDTRVIDRRATFRGLLRLDHMFFRLPPAWHMEVRRAASTFGSDHYPLVGTLRFN
jgi:endonuclease/exonuclease/phosphatase family metal-dependent hydrolase